MTKYRSRSPGLCLTLSLLKRSPRWNLALALLSDTLILSSLQPVSSLALTFAYFLLGGGRLLAGPPIGLACKGIFAHQGGLARLDWLENGSSLARSASHLLQVSQEMVLNCMTLGCNSSKPDWPACQTLVNNHVERIIYTLKTRVRRPK